MSSKKKLLTGCVLLVLSQAGWAAAEQTYTYKDPYEGYNRVMFNINDHLDRYIMTPVARGYRKVTPSPVRTGVNNFFNNLRDVVSFGSNLLRLDIEKASTDFVRVGINTTFGLGGLLDIADAGRIPNNKNTLGDTFASWGWKNSNYFVYPLLGPSTVRDSIGSTITDVFPIENAIFKEDAVRWSLTGLNGVASREALLDVTDSLNDAALDRYTYMRDVYMKLRNNQVGGSLFPADDDDDDDIDNLVAPGSDNAVTQPASVSSSQSVKKVTESDDNVPATTDSTPDKNTGDNLTESPVSASQSYWNVH
ncbi:Surface lipoprotein [Snodgrassella alvi wkB2]|uniref:VacJ family lipoprotein n=1 Tax=Snodgrassella alvi TaxID=1196083 RepID=A0ABD7Z0Z5_9NEIS|nr:MULTISPECIES: VacJ family lipoprotein [Snodgrassella]AHN29034.1 Surface lipoprotein [Snodgrassella alvi wkB2]MBI0165516.1 VacJ family lipoprotein [Snodgrassella sp. M0351]PIT45559.1 ABC transporter [Snodgrassella alvi]UOO97927.1 VacJ family lipoprotein [Snodgrassella alvi wkB2]WLS98128.1 VacJ family lipoprotein [Snodgrassella alvi]